MPLRVEPYGSHQSTPSIDSFPKPSLDYVDPDLKRYAQERAWNARHSESVSSARDMPQLPESLKAKSSQNGVDSLSKKQLVNNAENESYSLWKSISSMYDSVKSYFVGSPNEESPAGSPLSGNPKLDSPSQLGYSQANMENIAKLMEGLNQILDKMQEVTKESLSDATSTDEIAMLNLTLQILKESSRLLKQRALMGAEATNILLEGNKKDHQKIKDLLQGLNNVENKALLADKIITGSKVVGGLLFALQIAEVIGYVTLNPGISVAANMMKAAVGITSGASTLVKSKLDKEKVEHKGKMQIIRHDRDQRSSIVKDYRTEIKSAHQGAASALHDASQLITQSNQVKDALAKKF